ncbi:MAG: hypothetical protein HZC40_05165 [Chloroflexi bacterium]|nr:hypothetical protein [Chloroflexota bacterium]
MNLVSPLNQLEHAQLVRRLPEEEMAYIFKHALTQENARNSLLQKQRREIHLCVAHAYEQLYAENLDEHAALLAQHYAESGDDAKTREYLMRAGDVAARVNANVEAIAHYTRALDRAQRAGAHPQDLQLKLGRLYELSDQHDRALTLYAEMETRARECGDRAMELAALMARATIYSIPSKQSDRQLAQTLCDQALELARAIGDQPAEAKILWNLLLLNTRLRTNYRHAIGYGEQALAIARKLELREQIAYLLNDLSLPYAYAIDPERGIELNLQARQMWREMNIAPMIADNLSYAAMIYIALARYQDAIAAAEEAYALSLSIGNVWGQAFSQSWVGEAYRAIGHVAQAITSMEDAIRTAVSGFQAPLAFTRADLGALYGDLGMIARGIELAELAYRAGRNQAQVMVIWTAAQLGHLYLRDGQIARAATYIAEATETITPTDHESLFGAANILAEAELMLAQNDYPRAIAACDRFIEYKHSHRLRQDLPNALYIKGIALCKSGNTNEAMMILNAARVEAEDTNARWIWWRILAALAEMETDSTRARALRTHARAIIEYIADHTPQDLRASFLNVPDVKSVLK